MLRAPSCAEEIKDRIGFKRFLKLGKNVRKWTSQSNPDEGLRFNVIWQGHIREVRLCFRIEGDCVYDSFCVLGEMPLLPPEAAFLSENQQVVRKHSESGRLALDFFPRIYLIFTALERYIKAQQKPLATAYSEQACPFIGLSSGFRKDQTAIPYSVTGMEGFGTVWHGAGVIPLFDGTVSKNQEQVALLGSESGASLDDFPRVFVLTDSEQRCFRNILWLPNLLYKGVEFDTFTELCTATDAEAATERLRELFLRASLGENGSVDGDKRFDILRHVARLRLEYLFAEEADLDQQIADLRQIRGNLKAIILKQALQLPEKACGSVKNFLDGQSTCGL